MSFSRYLSAIGAVLIFIGGATGISDLISPKISLLITLLGGAINIFTERLQGGLSSPSNRIEANEEFRKELREELKT